MSSAALYNTVTTNSTVSPTSTNNANYYMQKNCNYVYNKLLGQTYVNRKYVAKCQDNLNIEFSEGFFRSFREVALDCTGA